MNRLLTLLGFFALPILTACQTNKSAAPNSEPSMTTNEPTHVAAFVADYADYEMDIEAAGLATLPVARLTDGELYVKYAYVSGSETRQGAMTLTDAGNHRFTGRWRTEADNGNVYSGTLFFDFRPDGTASGTYTFGGSTYNIPIRKR